LKYTFGTVCLDTGGRTVSGPNGPVHLTRKAFDLLVLLIEARPNAVSKDDLHARLWPDTFVAESSLQNLIHEIRHAIDSPATPASWIRTVHSVGYSFCGDVVSSVTRVSVSGLEPIQAWLIGESTRVPLRLGENILGRGLEDVTEIDLPTISRRHARIVATEDTITLEDLGSKNGTWLKDERLSAPRLLADGDVLCLGSARFRLRLAQSPDATESSDILPPAADLRKNSG
jgi:DNA-binding winged helix-turn-helix (wHTH) protein